MDTDTTGNIDVLTITAMDTITPNADLVDTLQAIGAGPDIHENDTTTMADFTTSIEKVLRK